MCGIAGAFSGKGPFTVASVGRIMNERLAHRGPDGHGFVQFYATENGYHVESETDTGAVSRGAPFAFFGHARLAILDLTEAGRQPMANDTGSVWITYNGEVYNHAEVRTTLEREGLKFHSRTDTEVVLKAYEAWGADAVQHLNGIFAFAILDLREHDNPILFLARDRFGVKPLYVADVDGTCVFASEIKALLAYPGVPRRLSLPALDKYLTFLWVPEPDTMLADVCKLPPGHWMRVTRGGRETRAYWKPRVRPQERGGDDAELVRVLREHLERACSRQMMSDVPVGALLSGGLDSTAVVALAAAAGMPPARGFTVGFSADDQAYEGFPDDLPHARQAAKLYGVPLAETVLHPDLADLLPQLVWHLDEPMADPAIMPLYSMCIAARRDGIKVLLSGMGADELFGGYRRHAAAAGASIYARIPRVLRRRVLAPLVEAIPSAGRGRIAPTARRLKRLVRGLEDPSGSAYVGLASWTTRDERHKLYAPHLRARMSKLRAWDRHVDVLDTHAGESLLNQMLAGDLAIYMPSHNLNYTDKIGMAAGVEIRVPFLDNDLVDFALTLPDRMKVHHGETKRALRMAVADVLPPGVLSRGKSGLGAPIRAWLVGPLKPLVASVLSRDRLEKRGLFDPSAVERLQRDLESGREDTSYTLWALLVLELWLDQYEVQKVAS